MPRHKEPKYYGQIALCILMIFIIVNPCSVIGQAEPPQGLQQKLEGISAEEKTVLQNLFSLAQEITLMESEEKQLAKDIAAAKEAMKDIEKSIAAEELAFQKNKDGLEKVLKAYQRMGPGTFLEIIMDSDSLTTFIRRVNTLRDITRNTGKMLERIEGSKQKLETDRKRATDQLELIEAKQKQAQEALQNKMKLKAEQEQVLASLKEKRKYYQEQLASLQQMLEELKPTLSEAAKDFSKIAQDGNLSPEAVKISYSLFSIKGSIDDKSFNDILGKQPELPKMTFQFYKDKVEMSLPDNNLVITGNFIIENGHLLKFHAEQGTFYGMPLEAALVERLFSDGELVLDFTPILGKNELQSIKLQDGVLELFIKLNLF